MNWLKSQLAKVIVRHTLNALGAWLVTKGILSGSEVSQAAGAIAVLAAVGHSLWDKRAVIKADLAAVWPASAAGQSPSPNPLRPGGPPPGEGNGWAPGAAGKPAGGVASNSQSSIANSQGPGKVAAAVLVMVCLIAFGASAQTNTAGTNSAAAPAVTATNTPLSWGLVGQAIWNAVKTASNYSVSPYATYAENAPKGHQLGGGVLFVFDVSDNVGIGMGVDYLGSFNMVNGNVTIKQALRPLTYLGMTSAFASNFTVTPFGIAGACSPISSAGSANGSVGAIYGAGFNLDLCQFELAGTTLKLSTGYARTEWSGLGAYSGWRDSLFLGLRAGF
jgi:hypothetical protein